MRIIDIIEKKREKKELSKEEIEYFIIEYTNGNIKDYQAAALIMAIFLNGMTDQETTYLTLAMAHSGEILDLSTLHETIVDKHSTGGVGDSTTLIVGPMCAALGLHLAKMSGRGLGLTGGTIDKVESIPGFNVNLSEEDFYTQVEELGFALSSQTNDLVPLDKMIYALRDVTGTTESIPLIASSIMSKKIAAGADNILIDIKVGTGALIKTMDDAKTLSEYLIEIGDAYNKNVRTIISDMNTPLSYAIGNSLEVCEAINVLHGKKCPLYNACIEIVANLLSMAKDIDLSEAEVRAEQVLKNGDALKKFYEFVSRQGGKLKEVVVAPHVIPVKSKQDGVITKIDAHGAAKLAAKLGASKMSLDDKIDYTVGLILNYKVGDKVKKDDTLLNIYTNKYVKFNEADFDFIEVE